MRALQREKTEKEDRRQRESKREGRGGQQYRETGGNKIMKYRQTERERQGEKQ